MRGIYHVLAVLLLSACTGEPSEPTAVVPGSCPAGMIYIPGGDYVLGRTIEIPEWDQQVTASAPPGFWTRPNPARKIAVTAFCIDQFEYPNKRGQVPKTRVSWVDATELCSGLGKRLPTRLEWQAAAQGPEGWLHSYGPKYDRARCNTEVEVGRFESIGASGNFPDCRSPLGVHDLDGNISEWVSDLWEGPWFDDEVWGAHAENPRTLMGGTAWPGDAYGQDSTSRHRHRPGEQWDDDGFRCAADPGPSR